MAIKRSSLLVAKVAQRVAINLRRHARTAFAAVD
jgi:hypothetical protein